MRLLAPERRRTRLVLAGALLATVALRVPYLRVPLGVDEGGVAFIARAWGTGHGSLYGAYWLDRPPLLVALYKLAVLGGATGVRLLGGLAAVALVVATASLARAVAGERAARVAAVLSAVMASSVALAAVYSPAELLAAGPAAASVLCLVTAARRPQAGWLVGAGLLAVCAALVKQSFLDAGLAGVGFLVATAVQERRLPVRRALAYAAGALVPLLGVAVWLLVARVSPGAFFYAVAGFRLDGLHALAASNLPLPTRLHALLGPGALSGVFPVLAVGAAGLWGLRRERVVAVTLAAWLAGAGVGVLGGGSYWSHYLIQLIAPASVLAAAALARLHAPARIAVTGAIAASAAAVTVGALALPTVSPQQRGMLAIARYVRANARPGDTQYVMYARANLGFYTGLPSPYPYAWSLMVRAVPGATGRLRALLDSPRRPTWIVVWQRPNLWHLDPRHELEGALRRHYRVAARIDGRAVYRRSSR